MDRYTKFILTLIAVSLSAIAIKMWNPQEAHAAVFGNNPTLGDIWKLREIENPDQRKKAHIALRSRIPLFVKIRGSNLHKDTELP